MLVGILSFWTHVGSQFKYWAKPATATLVRGTIEKVTVNVSGEQVLDLEMESLGLLVRE